MRARFKNTCHMCTQIIFPGSEIRKSRSGKWIHALCADYAAAKTLINAGRTSGSNKRSAWRIGVSPSNNRNRRA